MTNISIDFNTYFPKIHTVKRYLELLGLNGKAINKLEKNPPLSDEKIDSLTDLRLTAGIV